MLALGLSLLGLLGLLCIVWYRMVSYHVDIPQAPIIPEQHVTFVDRNPYLFHRSLLLVKGSVSWYILLVQPDDVWYYL